MIKGSNLLKTIPFFFSYSKLTVTSKKNSKILAIVMPSFFTFIFKCFVLKEYTVVVHLFYEESIIES